MVQGLFKASYFVNNSGAGVRFKKEGKPVKGIVAKMSPGACFYDEEVDGMGVKGKDKVSVEYTGTLEDGTVFDSSQTHGKPLEFEAGAGMVIKGFDDAVIGMEKGTEKEFRLKPSEAYGEHDKRLVRKVPRDKLPEGELHAGTILLVRISDGTEVPATITEINGKEATIDLNHPLAGKTLIFRIMVVEIS